MQTGNHTVNSLFGTSGIRGVLGRTITPSLAYRMGIVFARYLGDEPEVMIGYDVRIHSRVLYEQAVLGLVDGGAKVLLADILPTPALLHAQLEYGCDGSIMVTGSHSIPSLTGLLFFLRDGGETDTDSQADIERLYAEVPSLKRKEGKIEGKVDAVKIYKEKLLRSNPKLDGIKVIFDAGNGCMAELASKVLAEAGAKVFAINDKRDGSFPGRQPYPRKETLGGLSREVRRLNAELGVATDGDGDRAIFASEYGKILQGDVTGCILADEELRYRKGSIVAPLNSSNAISDICSLHQSRLITTGVGPPKIVKAIRENKDVIFAFEETGKYIWPEHLLYGDALFSTFKMISLLRRRKSSLSIESSLLPKYFMMKKMVRCREEEKSLIMSRVERLVKEKYSGELLDARDGIKVKFEDGSWILIRPSGTEPYFRCYAESTSASKAKELIAEGLKIIELSRS